jgi:hypothetical protein
LKATFRKLLLWGGLLILLFGAACSKKKPQSQVEADVTRPTAKWVEIEPVRLLRDYVRIDTTLERGEQEGAEFLQRILECPGIETEIVCPAPRRCNLLARLPGRRREGALLLLNHIDVAPVNVADWGQALPFAGTIKGGYIYGRGTYDMKSLALAQALAMRSLALRGIVPESDVLFLGEADEEEGTDEKVKEVLEERGSVLLVDGMADGLEDPADRERGEADAPVNRRSRREVDRPEGGEHAEREPEVERRVVKNGCGYEDLRRVERPDPESPEHGRDSENDQRDPEDVAGEIAAGPVVGPVVREKGIDPFHPVLRLAENSAR